jgi:hypothetical protein
VPILPRPLPPEYTNLTIQIEPFILHYARWQAFKSGTSLNAILEDFLADYAGVERSVRRRRIPRPPSIRAYRNEALRRHRAGLGPAP